MGTEVNNLFEPQRFQYLLLTYKKTFTSSLVGKSQNRLRRNYVEYLVITGCSRSFEEDVSGVFRRGMNRG